MRLPHEVVDIAFLNLGLPKGAVNKHPEVLKRTRLLERKWNKKQRARGAIKRDVEYASTVSQIDRLRKGSEIYRLMSKNEIDLTPINDWGCREPAPDFEDMAIIDFVGNKMIEKAKICLSPQLKRLAVKWQRTSSSVKQWMVSTDLKDILKCNSSKNWSGVVALMDAQKVENIFPHLFGQAPWGNSCRLNCLGRTIACAAFFRIAGARDIHSVSYIESLQERTSRLKGAFASEHLKSCAAKSRTPLEKRVLDFLEMTVEDSWQCGERISYPHLGLIVKQKDGMWVNVDPLLRISYPVSPLFNVEIASATLKKLHASLKGSTIYCEAPIIEQALQMKIGIICSKLIQQFQEENVLEELIDENDPTKIIISRELECMFAYLILLGFVDDCYYNRVLNDLGINELSDLAYYDHSDGKLREFFLQYVVSRKEIDRIEALRENGYEWTKDSVRRTIIDLPHEIVSLYSLVWHNATRDLNETPRSSNMEVGQIENQIGLFALTHIATLTGQEDKTVKALLPHGWNQYILFNAATVRFRHPNEWEEINPLAEEAWNQLQSLPLKLNSVRLVS